MPSGKTHDLLTVLLLPPTFVAGWLVTREPALALLLTFFTLFGGFMFGPDLDTHSRQYTRWGFLRFLWLPYKVVFSHRSRWSHGILFGTLIRVLYFSGVCAILIALGVYLRALLVTGGAPTPGEAWQQAEVIYEIIARQTGDGAGLATFAGLWWGAAIHTIADVVWSMLKKGKEIL
jgi:uncharacterized metal-binding protein